MTNLPRVFILAGGFGTRLKSIVHDRPKALAQIDVDTFLEIQLQWLSNHGVKEIVLLTGYKSDQIASFVEGSAIKDVNVKIVCVTSKHAMIKHCRKGIKRSSKNIFEVRSLRHF